MTERNGQTMTRREQRRVDRREALKAAAIEVFSEKGYHQAKVSEIVERVGVAQGTFYLYYEGKQQLFGELLQDFLTLVLETVAAWEPAALETRQDLARELTRVGMMLTQVLDEHRGLASIFFKEALAVGHDFEDLITEFYSTIAAMLTHFNQVLCERGVIAPMNFKLLAYATLGQVERIISEHVVTRTIEEVGHEELVEHLVFFFLSGTDVAIKTAHYGPQAAATPKNEEQEQQDEAKDE